MARRFAALDAEDVDSVQDLLESAPDFTERVTGFPPGPSDALSTLIGRPENVSAEDKLGFGLWDAGELVAIADVLRHYPDEQTAFVGLLLVRGSRQRQGIGRDMHARVLGEIRTWSGVERVALAIVASNATVAEPFWSAVGYASTDTMRPWRYGGVVSSAQVWELVLVLPGGG